MAKKLCSRCGLPKNLNDFYLDYKSKRRRQSQCKMCHGEVVKAWQARNRDKVNALARRYGPGWRAKNKEKCAVYQKRAYVKRKFGLTLEAYERLMQQSTCDICGKKLGKSTRGKLDRRKCLDHCHKTKVVRGVLCNTCNIGLGYFQDSVGRLKAAIAYIEKPRS